MKHINSFRFNLRVTAIICSVILSLYLGLSVLGSSAAMHIPRLPVGISPASVGLHYQDISFSSRVDNTRLEGWFIPSSGDSVIIFVHGGFQNRVDPTIPSLDLARDLVEKGYSLLLFDMRGRGNSDGIGRSLTHADRDIGGAVDYLKHKGYSTGKIGLMGFCSGAADACIFTSQDEVGSLVLDGCFTSVKDMVFNLAHKYGIPRPPVAVFLPGVQMASRLFFGYQAINPIDVIDKVKCPILFIHEETDVLVSSIDIAKLSSKAGSSYKTIWEIHNSEHTKGYQSHPDEYVTKISDFFNNTIGITAKADLR